MTKHGYTHIIVPMELRSILKERAKSYDLIISNYITEPIKKGACSKWLAEPKTRVQLPGGAFILSGSLSMYKNKPYLGFYLGAQLLADRMRGDKIWS